MPELEKLCVNCPHFDVDPAEKDWSEETPGCSLSIRCTKGHWEIDNYESTTDDYRKALLTAQACKDWTPRKETP